MWRRIDVPGHDACWLESTAGGWRIRGTAIFLDPAGPARLDYEVDCGPNWVTRNGSVHGYFRGKRIDIGVVRTEAGEWKLNGVAAPGLEHCLDLDLGFTPATNLSQLRRLALDAGDRTDLPVAWLDTDPLELSELRQRYERRTGTTYWYEAPRFDYAAMLEVSPVGFVRSYPGLWEIESNWTALEMPPPL